VHIGGLVTDELPGIVDLLARKGLWLVEDAAHAHGSLLNDKHAAPLESPDIQLLSDKGHDQRRGWDDRDRRRSPRDEARLYRDQGKASFGENIHVRMGNNWRLSEPHAIIGLRHFEHLATMIAARRRLAARYAEALAKREPWLAAARHTARQPAQLLQVRRPSAQRQWIVPP